MTGTTLARAKGGDQDAFAELVDPYRRQLLVHCYRILGSFQDAEDVLQEVLLSAWRALDDFDGASLRAWLYRIATNRCLNYLRDGARRPTTASFSGRGAVRSDEPWWLEPYPDFLLDDAGVGPEARYETRESIALSFVAGLQKLPPQQRAALVLRDVLGFSASETAEILGSTTPSVNSALQRARAGFRPGRHPELVALPRSSEEAEVVRRFVEAFESGDPQLLVGLLTEDARLTMPPDQIGYQGPPAIVEFLRLQGIWDQGLRMVATRANGQPAFAYYLPDPNSPIWRANGLVMITVKQHRVSGITRFGDTGLLARFGLPRTLPRG
ncbi:MAG TPA: sigma-70 family RNA polymerase sigma factor [Acidimicrobiales bacterium]|nr:sigma-70 family RNA polymerase sigma factor [Acidimicrobiales bacterium]